MPSHITYPPGQVVAFEDQALQQLYLSSARYIQQESNLSQRVSVYSWDSNQGAENHAEPKILNVGETKVLSSGDAAPLNSEDSKSVKSEIKFEIKASPKPLESKMHPLTCSSDFSGHSVSSLKVCLRLRLKLMPSSPMEAASVESSWIT